MSNKKIFFEKQQNIEQKNFYYKKLNDEQKLDFLIIVEQKHRTIKKNKLNSEQKRFLKKKP